MISLMLLRTFSTVLVNNTSAYAAGDQVGNNYTEIPKIVTEGGTILLDQILCVDWDKQKAAMDFLFWNAAPDTTSGDNDPHAVTDAEVRNKLIARVPLLNTDYADSAAQSYACIRNLGAVLTAKKDPNGNRYGTSLWFTVVMRGTPTYGATNQMAVKMSFRA